MANRTWSDHSPRTHKLLIVLGLVEAALFVAAEVDLTRRPSALVTGSKTTWRMLSAVNLIGPLAFFLQGRRTQSIS